MVVPSFIRSNQRPFSRRISLNASETNEIIYGFLPYLLRVNGVLERLVRVETLLPRKDVEAIDGFVAAGAFATRAELIRAAVRRLLYSEERVERMGKAFELVEKRLKKLGVKPEELLKEFENRESGKKAEELVANAKARARAR